MITQNAPNSGRILAGPISNGGLTTAGSGILTLSGTNTYTGATTINSGTLRIGNGGTTGSLSTSSTITNNGTLAFDRSNTITQGTDFNAVISGSGALVQNGNGTLTLTGTNTYTGPTSVNAGTLVVGVDNVGSITSDVTVNNGATLKGTGTIDGTVTVRSGATYAPGNSIGVQTVTDLELNSGSIFQWEMNDAASNEGTRGINYDAVNVSNSLTGPGGAIFEIVLPGTTTFADTFWTANRAWADIFTNGTDPISDWAAKFGSFAFANADGVISAPIASTQGSFTLTGNTLSWQAIPEPSTTLAGLLLAAGLLRRKR